MITEAGEVEIRFFSFHSAWSELPRLRNHLNENELQRGNRLLDERQRDRFFIGRGMLRERLAEHLGVAPQEVRLAEGEFGKLYLPDHNEGDTIRFNVSHAGDYLLLAFAVGCEVGCDVEQLRDIEFRPMAERYFSEREREELFSLQQDQQLRAFFRCWTRKEAYMKGSGTGFSQLSTDFDVSLLPHHAPALVSHRRDPVEPARWTIADIDAPDGYCAALALQNHN